MSRILRPLGQIRIPAPPREATESRFGSPPEPWLVPYYAEFEALGHKFVIIDAQVKGHPPVTDGRFGYTFVHRQTGMGAKECCEMEMEAALRKGPEICAMRWTPAVEHAIARWEVLNP